MEYLLIALICPVGMGVMMWLMMRGGKPEQPAAPDLELQRMRAELDELRRTQQPGSDRVVRE